MTLTLRILSEVIDHALDGPPGTPLEKQLICNMAGRWLTSAHEWRWLQGRSREVLLRPVVDIVAGTWAEASLQLTITDPATALANYTFVNGDKFQLTAGTGAQQRDYKLESRISSTVFQLEESIGAAADTQVDIAGSLPNDIIDFPRNIRRIDGYAATNSLINTFNLTHRQRMLQFRTVQPGISTLNFWGLLSWVIDPDGGPPVKRMEVWPQSSGTTTDNKFVLWVTEAWTEITADDQQLTLPTFLESFYLEAVKAHALGQDQEHVAPLVARLGQLKQSDWFMDLKLEDGMDQRDLGPLQGGAYASQRTGSVFQQENRVANPS